MLQLSTVDVSRLAATCPARLRQAPLRNRLQPARRDAPGGRAALRRRPNTWSAAGGCSRGRSRRRAGAGQRRLSRPRSGPATPPPATGAAQIVPAARSPTCTCRPTLAAGGAGRAPPGGGSPTIRFCPRPSLHRLDAILGEPRDVRLMGLGRGRRRWPPARRRPVPPIGDCRSCSTSRAARAPRRS